MTLITILHNAWKAMVQIPMLWFFSILVFLTYNLATFGQGYYAWIGCIGVLFFPLTALGQAGQIRSIHLWRDQVSSSIPQIIKYTTRYIVPMLLILILEVILALILTVPLMISTRLLLNQYITSGIFVTLMSIASPIAVIICSYARCVLIISDLPIKSIAPIVFRALRIGIITNILLVIMFGLIHYILTILFPIFPGTPLSIALYLVFSLIIVCLQAAVYTFAYIQFIEVPLAVQPA